MKQLIRRNIVIAVGAGLLGLYAVVGALAAPDVTPWPDPFQSSPDDVTVQEEPSDPSAPSDPSEPSEPTEPSEPSEPSDPEDGDGDSVGTEQVEDGEEHGGGVPADAPPCALLAELLGCREVEIMDGHTLNLPNPAADGIERARELAEQAQQLAQDAQQNAENGDGQGAPEGTEQGAPDDVSQGAPDDVSQGAPDDVSQGAPDVPRGRP